MGAVVYLPTYTCHLFVTQSMFLDLSFWEVGNIIIEFRFEPKPEPIEPGSRGLGFRFANPLDQTW